jgi:hypothetical protein
VSALSLPLLLAFVAPATDSPPGGGAPTSPPVETAPVTSPATSPETAPVTSPEPAPSAPEVDAGVPSSPLSTPPPAPVPAAAPAPARKPPPSYGPFFVGDAPSDTAFPNARKPGDPPRLSVGNGAFCFIDDAMCKASMLLTADVGVGVNLVGGTGAPDLPYAQFTFRGGLVIKPLTLGARSSGWHPWGIGLIGGWSRGTGASRGEGDNAVALHHDTTRVMIVNQLWLSKKRNGFHLDLDVGLIRSSVRNEPGRFFGTSAAVSANWGGWGGLFMSADLLDHDTRLVFGFRGHGLATAPAVGLILLGLLAGGAFGGAS